MYTIARFNKEILAEIFKSKDKTVYHWIGKDNRIYVAWKKATMISVFEEDDFLLDTRKIEKIGGETFEKWINGGRYDLAVTKTLKESRGKEKLLAVELTDKNGKSYWIQEKYYKMYEGCTFKATESRYTGDALIVVYKPYEDIPVGLICQVRVE